MKSTTGLVLTGGGAKTAYQVGVLAAIAEIVPGEACPFQVISGTSAGAINAAYLASRANDWPNAIAGLKALWAQIELNKVFKTGGFSLTKVALGWIVRTIFGGKIKTAELANYLLNTQPLRELIKREVSFSAIEENLRSGKLRGVCFSAAQYTSGNTVTFYDGIEEIKPWTRSNRVGIRTPLNEHHVLASSAIPIFFPPIQIDSDFYGDGCLRQTAPLSPAIHLGADRILSIGIRNKKVKPNPSQGAQPIKPRPPSLAQISGELMNSIFLDSVDADIERMQRINQSVSHFGKVSSEATEAQTSSTLKNISILHLRPSRDLKMLIPFHLQHFPFILRYLLRGLGVTALQGNDLITYLSFMPECSKVLMDLGYEDTMKRRSEVENFLA